MLNRLILAVAFVLLIAPPALAEPRLKPAAYVDAAIIHIGDLFEGAGALAGREVGPAPAPGMTAVYRANHLAAIARAYDLAWQPVNDEQSIAVSRLAASGETADIARLISDALHGQGIDGELKVTLSRQPALTASHGGFEVRDLRADIKTGRFAAALARSGHDGTIAINGQYETVLQVPTPTHTIARGDTISAGDVTLTEQHVDGTPGNLLTQLDKIVGKEVQRTLRAGKPINAADVVEPALVTKGNLVTMTLTAPGLVLTGTGRALDDGRRGDPIKVMNVRSKRTIEGIVAGADLVEVQMGRQIATSAIR